MNCMVLVLGLEYVKVGERGKEEAPGAPCDRLVSREVLASIPGWPRVAGILVPEKEFPQSLYSKLSISQASSRGRVFPGQTFSRRPPIVRLLTGARFFSSGSFCAYIICNYCISLFSFYINLQPNGANVC